MTDTSKFELDLISPERGERYTIVDLIKKALDRANVAIVTTREKVYKTGYGDTDYLVKMVLLIDGSNWNDSIEGTIDMTVPAHTRLSGWFDGFDFGCGEAYDVPSPDCWTTQKDKLYIRGIASVKDLDQTFSLTGDDVIEFARMNSKLLESILCKSLISNFFYVE